VDARRLKPLRRINENGGGRVEGLEGEEAVEVVTGAWVEKGSRGRRRAAKEGLWEEERRKRGMARLRERERARVCKP